VGRAGDDAAAGAFLDQPVRPIDFRRDIEQADDVQVEQGYEMGRPSLLWLKAEQADRSIRVQVGGRVVMVAQGRFF